MFLFIICLFFFLLWFQARGRLDEVDSDDSDNLDRYSYTNEIKTRRLCKKAHPQSILRHSSIASSALTFSGHKPLRKTGMEEHGR